MDCNKTIDLFAEAKRLCDLRTACVAGEEQCPLFGFCGEVFTRSCAEDVKTAIETVQKWSDEHPVKTYAQDFFEKFPDAPKDKSAKSEYPDACRNMIYGGGCPNIECDECWNEPMEE